MFYNDPHAKAEFLDTISRSLSGSAASQLQSALQTDGVGAFAKKLFCPSLEPHAYVPVLTRERVPRWFDPDGLRQVRDGISGPSDLEGTPYFANPLAWPDGVTGDESDEELRDLEITEPSVRVLNAGFVVLTIEFDANDLAALEIQLGWCRRETGRKRDSDCALGRFNNLLRDQFQDYRGVCAVWGGNKSVHFHFVFDLTHLRRTAGNVSQSEHDGFVVDITPEQLKDLHIQCWHRLQTMFCLHLPCGMSPDTGFANYLRLRRLPWGTRLLKTENLVGCPAGSRVPQLSLLDLTRTIAGRGASSLLFDPALIRATSHPEDHTQATPQSRVSLSADDLETVLPALKTRLAAWFRSPYPEPVRLECVGGELIVNFRNNAGDNTPASYVRGNYRRIHLLGRGASTADQWLPDTIENMVLDVLGQPRDQTLRRHPRTATKHTSLKSLYFQRTISSASCRDELRHQHHLAVDVLARHPGNAVIQGEPGLGKSHALMTVLPGIHQDRMFEQWVGDHEPGCMAFASRSFAQAEGKAHEFAAVHPGNEFRSVFLPSFPEAYRRVCRHKGATPATLADAARAGASGMYDFVSSAQPDIFQAMNDLRDTCWTDVPFDPLRTCIFTSQATIKTHGYKQGHPSRAWLHPDFGNNGGNEASIQQLSRDMMISTVIFDEVEIEDLVHIASAEHFAFAKKVEAGCIRGGKRLHWDQANLSDRYASYTNACQRWQHRSTAPTYEDVASIIDADFGAEDYLELDPSVAPLVQTSGKSDDLYRRCIGKGYYVKSQRWWEVLGGTVYFLTTERIPTTLAERLGVPVYRSELPGPTLDRPTPYVLEPKARVGDKDRSVIADFVRRQMVIYPDLKVIADGCGGLRNVFTHQRAKGSNDLATSRVMSVIQHPAVALYERLCAIAQRFGISGIVSMYYADMLEQALGRNRGYRSGRGGRHVIAINPNLLKKLGEDEFLAQVRYPLQKVRDYDQAWAIQ